MSIDNLLCIIRKNSWMLLRDTNKYKAKITVCFYILNSSDVKLGLPMPQHKHNFMIPSDKPIEFTFNLRKRDLFKKDRGLSRICQQYRRLRGMLSHMGYTNISPDTRIYLEAWYFELYP